jgi:hypothetical protein
LAITLLGSAHLKQTWFWFAIDEDCSSIRRTSQRSCTLFLRANRSSFRRIVFHPNNASGSGQFKKERKKAKPVKLLEITEKI